MAFRLFSSRRPKLTVQMFQLNSVYGNKVYLPYSAGMLKSYASQFEEIQDAYAFAPFLLRREPVDVVVGRIGSPDVLALSGYVWNWRLSMAVAEAVRKRREKCLILVGGPHVPNLLGDFFTKYPFIDIVCHGEGEQTFHEILKRYASDESLCGIPGSSFHDRRTGEVFQNPRRERIRDLDMIPSPYLNGTFDHLLEGRGADMEWMAMWETNRGCPYSCTFCDWGSATASKVRAFGMDRLIREIDWFGRNRIRWVFGCDANFGILKRDEELADALVRVKERTGHPEVFRVCYAKNSDAKVYKIATILNAADMDKGISLSMQSLNRETLKRIKRGNIKLETFHKLQAQYLEADIPTFTELIIALPGETYDSFKEGIDKLLDNGQHSQINIYNCSVMPNAEMGDPDYQRIHKIKTVEIPIFQPHASPDEGSVQEFEPVVVSTETLPVEDWRRTYHFAWAVQCFHLLKIFQPTAIALRNLFGVGYSEFYEAVLDYGRSHPDSLIAGERKILDDVLDNVLAEIGFDQYLPQFSDITWPPEEASFLRFSERIGDLSAEFQDFLGGFFHERDIELDREVLEDLLLYQRMTLVHYERSGNVRMELGCNIHEFLESCMLNRSAALERGEFVYEVVDHLDLAGD
ncbi:MAG: radical SAM protein, partial [bacterium]